MEKEPITLNGLKKLEEELIFLKEKKRPEIVAAIAEARSHGDLKENAEYHAAKEEQSHNEGRITEINDIIVLNFYCSAQFIKKKRFVQREKPVANWLIYHPSTLRNSLW